MEDGPPPDSTETKPIGVIPYHEPLPMAVVREVTFAREGNVLTIAIPPGSLITRMVWGALKVCLYRAPASLLAFVIYWSIRQGDLNAVFLIPAAYFGWETVANVRNLVRLAQRGSLPTVVRVWSGGIAIQVSGNPRVSTLTRHEITHVQVRPGRGAWKRTLEVVIITNYGKRHAVPLPSPRVRPMVAMIELADKLRDVLGLPPGDQRSNRSTSNET